MANLLQKLFGKKANDLEKRGHLPYSQTPYSLTAYALQKSLALFQSGGGMTSYFEIDNNKNIRKALTDCPAVPYIINKKARAFCSGNIAAVYQDTLKPVKGLDIVYQTIIDKPNFLQTGYQFKMQNYAQMQSYGISVALKIYAAGMLSSVWVLPNDNIEIEWEADWTPFKRKNILSAIKTISYCGKELDKKDLYIFTDSTPNETSVILPVTRLKSLKYPINNLIINYESRGKLMNKPMGIITNNQKDNISAMEMEPDEIEKLHAEFDKYGLTKDQKRFIISNANVTWQPISFPLSDMQMDIFERNDTITIAEGLDYPPFLLGLSEKGIYNNVSEAYKALYTGSIIPDGENYVQQLVQCFESDKKGIIYQIDFSHLAVLQEGLKYKNEARKILGEAVIAEFEKNLITFGRAMELMSEINYNEAWKDLYFYQMPYNVKQIVTDETKK